MSNAVIILLSGLGGAALGGLFCLGYLGFLAWVRHKENC